MLLRRFVAPYKWNVVLNIVFNLLAAFMTLFSFAFIVPILQMLFQIDTTHYQYMDWSAESFKDVAINNFYYYTQQVIEQHGASVALACLAALLVVMTLVKVGVTYLSSYFIIPRHSQSDVRQDYESAYRLFHQRTQGRRDGSHLG